MEALQPLVEASYLWDLSEGHLVDGFCLCDAAAGHSSNLHVGPQPLAKTPQAPVPPGHGFRALHVYNVLR